MIDRLLLPDEIEIFPLGRYVLFAFCGSLAIRLVLTAVRAWRAKNTPVGRRTVTYRRAFRDYFLGFDPNREPWQDYGEYFSAFLLGWVELLLIPVLMVMGLHLYVGSWITLKTIAIYFRWESDRVLFNLFLLGNALTLAIAWECLTRFVYIRGI
jgi:hypothetical protein